MSAIALVLRAMGHHVSGSDLKDSPVAERLRSHGITVAVGHSPENVAGADAVTYSPAVQPENPELAEARAREHPGGAPLRDARRHLRHPALPGRLGHAREDDDRLHAVADPRRGGAAALLPHRCRRQRDRDQRRVGHGGVARRRGGRELRHLPGDRPRPGGADQRRAGPPRLLRHVRRAARRLRRICGQCAARARSSAPTTPRRRPSAGSTVRPRSAPTPPRPT